MLLPHLQIAGLVEIQLRARLVARLPPRPKALDLVARRLARPIRRRLSEPQPLHPIRAQASAGQLLAVLLLVARLRRSVLQLRKLRAMGSARVVKFSARLHQEATVRVFDKV